MMKQCYTCKRNLPESSFPKHNQKIDGLHPNCKECRNKHDRGYYKKNRNKIIFQMREKYWEDRIRMLEKLGGKCINCGEKDYRVLQVNHKTNDKEFRTTDRNINRKIISGKINSNNLDIRCANCNILYEYEIGRREILYDS